MIKVNQTDCKYFEKYFVRYSDYDYIYHVYHIHLQERPKIELNQMEHKNYCWVKPKDALQMDLIHDEDMSIKWFYNLD